MWQLVYIKSIIIIIYYYIIIFAVKPIGISVLFKYYLNFLPGYISSVF